MKNSLHSSEWTLVLSLLAIMASLVFVAKINTKRAHTILASLEYKEETPSEITITVQGAVSEPLQLTLPPQSRICDLKSKIPLSPEADLAFFKRRRLLKNGEVLRVPCKPIKETVAHK